MLSIWHRTRFRNSRRSCSARYCSLFVWWVLASSKT